MGKKILLEHLNVPGINTLEVYRQKGGYSSVEKALKTMTPAEVVEEVKKIWFKGSWWCRIPYRVEVEFPFQTRRGRALLSL